MLITRLWKDQPGKFFCISTKSASKRWLDTFFRRGQWREVEEFIEENSDKDIYFCPHGFSKPRRKEDVAVMPKMMWADLDEADPREAEIRPTIAIESSPGRYVGLWLLEDTLPSKNLNKRLTYHLGADHGGWDMTQVLRVPGTMNYKYQSTPRVRTLWIDGPSYSVKKISRLLPQEEESDGADDSVLEIYSQYEKSLPAWVRRELLNGKPTPGKRSEMMWKLVNTLLETGVSREDCFTLLHASPWNKFSDDQLAREIAKSSGNKFSKRKSKAQSAPDYKFLAHTLEDVEEANIDWIWYPYIARSELTIIEGDPGVGKSYLAQMMCAAVADGKRLPSVKRKAAVCGKIAYFDLENDAGTVTKKRLVTNGCKKLSNYIQEEEPFSIDDEAKVEEVEDAIERIKPAVVVFDTLNTYIGGADTHKASEAQQAIGWFKLLAKRFNCAVVVLRHLTKGSRDGKALYRGQGSMSFSGMARVVMSVGTMPDDPETRVMAITKINVAQPPKALTFTITSLPDTLKESDRSKFSWGEFVDISADEFIGAVPKIGEKKSAGDSDAAQALLREMLERGSVELKKIERTAEARSISVKSLERAADTLGVKRTVRGFGKDRHTMWSLPD